MSRIRLDTEILEKKTLYQFFWLLKYQRVFKIRIFLFHLIGLRSHMHRGACLTSMKHLEVRCYITIVQHSK